MGELLAPAELCQSDIIFATGKIELAVSDVLGEDVTGQSYSLAIYVDDEIGEQMLRHFHWIES
jgi:hypothetical protein